MDIYDLARHQAGAIEDLKRENSRLRSLTFSSPEPAVRPPKTKKRAMSLATRGKLSASWTKERRARQATLMSERISAYWAAEMATRPAHPNGTGRPLSRCN